MNDEDENTVPLITWPELLATAYRRRWWIALPTLGGGLVGLGAGFVMEPQYTSTASLLIASQEIPTALVASPLTHYADERIAKIRQQILSRSNLQQLIAATNLYPEERKTLTPEQVENLVRQKIAVDLLSTNAANHTGRSMDTTIAFSIAFTYRNPVQAQAVTERLTQKFITEDKRLRTEQASGTAAFLARRGNELQERLIDLQGKRREIEARYQGALPDQLALSTQSNSALRAEVSRIDAETQGIMGQNSVLAAREAELVSGPGAGGDSVRRAEERLAQLEAVYSDEHPDVRAARSALDVARNNADLPGGAGTRIISAEIAAGRSRIAELSHRRAQMVASIGQMEQLAALAPQAAYELNNLERDHDNLKLQYQDIREKQLEAQVAANLQAEDKGERFSLVDPPSLPLEPIQPKKQMMLLMGLFGGFAFGIALSIWLELFGNRVHGRSAVQRVTGSRPLVVIPDISDKPSSPFVRVFRRLLPARATQGEG
ncbi:GumC family protein [Sphingomonas sp. C3-2]|uniref:GumC family protein n=1 Tax=Sphingomonas sp. C3-2 TaxID=3062169 RepID=UPI00294AB335|nr:Wzz/FepE/Etk N-terminal domain-containing protein [Sphingomonas sp. C3-2]WOK36588.1 Wzz/FepE/Etk N-terminal domain-containing protein [Sphingomonas sp. C3-2]